jgi:4'-phosphopantetheinyl transferase
MTTGRQAGPRRRPALAAEAHVWCADLDRERYAALELPAHEQERASRIRSDRNRQRWVAARQALRLVLARYLGQDPERIEFSLGEHGKPALAASPPPLHFNISHSGELALIALALEREVGVDVEGIDRRRRVTELARVGLKPGEAAAVRAAHAERQADVFYDAWVRREAVAKCLGVGLGEPLPQVPVAVCGLEVGDDHAAALAIAGKTMPPLRHFRLDA